jgi:hypothetical protein
MRQKHEITFSRARKEERVDKYHETVIPHAGEPFTMEGKMEAVALVVSIVTGLLGGVSTFVSLLPFFGKKNAFEILAGKLREIQKTKDGERLLEIYSARAGTGKAELFNEHLQKWLGHGHLILAGLARKVTIRFGFLCLASAGLSAGIYVDGDSLFFHELTKRLEDYDIAISAFVAALPWFVRLLNRLLLPNERTFIKNLVLLEEVYYDTFIKPAMNEFNAEIGRLYDNFKYLRREEERQQKLRGNRLVPHSYTGGDGQPSAGD